jgi:flagellar biosynthesis protein FlhG
MADVRLAEAESAMMRDQATELRNLVRQYARQQVERSGPAPHILACLGGQPNMGCTTLAVNLAASCLRLGARVVLVDTDHQRGDVARLCGIAVRGGVSELLTARKDIHEVLQPGPSGIQLVPTAVTAETWGPGGGDRLLAQLRGLGRHTDLIVLDMGPGPSPLNRTFWTAADVILVTTPQSQSVMDCYALLKSLGESREGNPPQLVVSRVPDAETGDDVFERIDASCRQFLGLALEHAGNVEDDALVPQAAARTRLVAEAFPDAQATQAMQRLAARFVSRIANNSTRNQSMDSPDNRLANRVIHTDVR